MHHLGALIPEHLAWLQVNLFHLASQRLYKQWPGLKKKAFVYLSAMDIIQYKEFWIHCIVSLIKLRKNLFLLQYQQY